MDKSKQMKLMDTFLAPIEKPTGLMMKRGIVPVELRCLLSAQRLGHVGQRLVGHRGMFLWLGDRQPTDWQDRGWAAPASDGVDG